MPADFSAGFLFTIESNTIFVSKIANDRDI